MNNFAQRWLFSTNHKCDAMHARIAGSNRAGTTGAKPHATQPKVSRRVMSCVGVDGLVSPGKRVPPFSSEYLTLWGKRSVPENRNETLVLR
jgi:hypothetical protein